MCRMMIRTGTEVTRNYALDALLAPARLALIAVTRWPDKYDNRTTILTVKCATKLFISMCRENGKMYYIKENNMEHWLLPIFLIVEGLSMCGVPLHPAIRIIGGVCASNDGILMVL